MEPWKQHTFLPKSLEEVINTATVVLDTNVLLAAYQWRDVTVNEILQSLEILASANRIKIPSHVVKEFSRRRPGLIRDMINQVEQIVSQIHTPKELPQVVPPLFNTSELESASQKRAELLQVSKEYRSELSKIQLKLNELYQTDLVLERYEEIFKFAYFKPEDLSSDEELRKQFNERLKQNIPPGLKDGSKADNPEGDFIIWSHILKINNDVIFVTNDIKNDWVITDKHDKILTPRRELIEEFFLQTQGKTIIITRPTDFFQHIKPDLSEETKQDLSESESFTNANHTLVRVVSTETKQRKKVSDIVINDLTNIDMMEHVNGHLLTLLINLKLRNLAAYEYVIERLKELKLSKDAESIQYYVFALHDFIIDQLKK